MFDNYEAQNLPLRVFRVSNSYHNMYRIHRMYMFVPKNYPKHTKLCQQDNLHHPGYAANISSHHSQNNQSAFTRVVG